MKKTITPGRIAAIFGKFQYEPAFRHSAMAIAKAINGMNEQDQNDCLRMAKRLLEWKEADARKATPEKWTGEHASLDVLTGERDTVMRRVE